MNITFQPSIIETATAIVEGLKESGFFIEEDVRDFKEAHKMICEALTQKFIRDSSNDEYFTEDEFSDLLGMIVANDVILRLKSKGIINSYGDENVEEVFFLTNKGKLIGEELKEKGIID